MRTQLTAVAILAAAGALLAPAPANATPGQTLTGVSALPQTDVQRADYLDRAERRLRRRGYTVIPPTPPVVAPAPVIVGETAVVPAVPVRPTSCGEYHYWNGVACVDARYYEPEE